MLASLLRHHLVRLARPNRTGSPAQFEVTRAAVGFVDLVGFTSLAQHAGLDDVGRLLATFEAAANQWVLDRGGRVIKFVGDAVMFRLTGLADACAAALDLVDRVADRLPLPARGGVAYGEVLVRAGDCFGPVANLAARAAGVAEPSTVVAGADESVDLSHGLATTVLPPTRLAGIDHPVSLVLLKRRDSR